MSKIKLSFSFLLTLMLVAMFSIVASAAAAPGKQNPTMSDRHAEYENAILNGSNLSGTDQDFDNDINNNNKTGSDVGTQDNKFNNVIKSDGMVKIEKDGTVNTNGTHRTHGEYQNNTNSCASCHQTHTAASKSLLFKNGEYTTCTACHDGTLGFYNVFEGSDSAGKFGGTHDGNMSVHLANGTVEVKAAPGGNRDADDTDAVWSAEFTCASCHAPHGSFSDRLLNPNPNHMGNLTADNGGKKLSGIKVVTDITSKASYTSAEEKVMGGNYVMYKFTATAADAAKTAYSTKVAAGDVVFQVMKWNASWKNSNGDVVGRYEEDNSPWLHGYDWDTGHTTKSYWSTINGTTTTKLLKVATDPAQGQVTKTTNNVSILNTDSISKNDGKVVQGKGFMVVKANGVAGFDYVTDDMGTIDATDDVKANKLDSIQYANIARGYVVDLDETTNTALTNTYGVPVTTTTVSSLWGNTWSDGQKHSGTGVAMSGFCAACHTDYLASTSNQTAENGGEGTYSHAYRHTTTSDTYTCVRCHYAHGTDVTIMRDARGNNMQQITDDTSYFTGVTGDARTALVRDYLMDKNPSSALKRYTNMSVCWGCHTSSHSEGIRNTDSFDNLSGSGATKDKVGLSTSVNGTLVNPY